MNNTLDIADYRNAELNPRRTGTRRHTPIRLSAWVVCLALFSPPVAASSVCYGTTANGALEKGCKLPYDGGNFRAYSRAGSLLGRTYVHCKVAGVITAAYGKLGQQLSDRFFVYGETGWASGGSFRPHKTHQNGLSVDFMVPVVDAAGRSVPLPTSAFNRYGYDIDFDGEGRGGGLQIDFEAMAAHILALSRSADEAGIGIWRVIFDPKLQPMLRSTAAWPALEGRVQFSTRQSWVRHDDHYHVDFAVPCRPMQ